MKASKILFLLLCLGLCNTSFSQTKVYLGYDANCMDRYEYHYNNNPTGNSHVAYHIIMNDREKVILEVGIESRINQARPKGVKTCNNFSINERMVRKINNGEVQLFIVKRNGNGYNVSEVGLAAYSQISPASISFSSMDSRFSYNYNDPANGKNIASTGSDSEVFFDGLTSHDCPKQYQFNKKVKGGGRNYVEWVVIPEIGIIQEKKGFNQVDAENNVLALTHINGVAVNQYLNDFCRSVDLDFYSGKFYDGKNTKSNGIATGDEDLWALENGRETGNTTIPTKRTRTNYTEPHREVITCNVYKDLDRGLYIDWGTGQPANVSCGGQNYINGYLEGERRTNTSVVTTPTRTVPTGKVVRVDPTPTTRYTPPTPTPRTNFCAEESAYGYHIVQRDETLFGIARTYGLSVDQLKKYNKLRTNRIYPCTKLLTMEPVKASTSGVVLNEKGFDPAPAGYHTVRKNETLYELSKLYGMNVNKFRALNGLGSADRIYVGQQLKVIECNCPNPDGGVSTTRADDIAYAPAADTRVVAYDNVPREYGLIGTERLVAKGNEQTVEYTDGRKRRFYVVKEDDTIYSIAKKYGINVEQLRRINDLEEREVIIPYQRIYLDL